MPATAGRVRMPANNRVHSSAALQTHGIWQSAIGYDPYAPAADSKGSKPDSSAADNAYASFQGLLSLARITGTAVGNETRGACKKCGRVGHLTYQCRNFLSLRDDEEKKDHSALQATANAAFEKIKKSANGGREKEESESDSDEEDEESSDSDVDPEIERIIAERFGKPLSKKVETLSRKNKKRSRPSSSDEDEERRKKRRHGRKKRRRSHSHLRRSDFDEDESDPDRDRKHKRRRKKRESDSDSSSSESSDGHRKRSNRHRKRPHKERRSVLSSESESTASSSDEDERREKRRSRGQRR